VKFSGRTKGVLSSVDSQKTKRVEHQAAGGGTLRGLCAVKRAEEEKDIECVFIHAVSQQLCVNCI